MDIPSILASWKQYKEIKVFTDCSDDFHDQLRVPFELEDDCLAGILTSIESDPADPFVKYFDSCVEGAKKLTQKVTSFDPANTEDMGAKKILLEKLKLMSELLVMVNDHYKIK
jgi:hypothetical protein